MQRRLWGRSTSSNVMKVVWALEELGLPYERIDVGGPFGKTDTPEYGAMNPNRLVPTLQEDDFILWESNAILRYLCTNHPSALWPNAPHGRANADRWMDWQQTALNAAAGTVFIGYVRTPEAERDMAAIDGATKTLGKGWAMLDAELARHPYVGNDAFGLADIPLGVHVHRWFALPIDRPDLPHLRAWYDNLLQRPAYRDHVARPMS